MVESRTLIGATFVRRLAARTDALLAALERRLGVWPTAAIVAASLLLLVCVYVTPAIYCIDHGRIYEALSQTALDPDVENRLRLRILTPLIAHVLHLRGPLYLFVPIGLGGLLLASVYGHFRGSMDRLQSLGMAAILATSTPILHMLHFGGYVDVTSYLLLFWCWVAMPRLWIVAPLFALALLNHESNVFAAPWLAALARLRSRSLGMTLATAFALLVALVPVALYRSALPVIAADDFAADRYVSADNVRESLSLVARMFALGVFMAFKLHWWFAIAGILGLWAHRRADALWIALVVAFAAAQLLFAHDTSRLLGLAFPAILAGAVAERERLGDAAFTRRLWALLALSLLVPQYYVGQDQAYPFFPSPVSFVLWVSGVYPWDLWWG